MVVPAPLGLSTTSSSAQRADPIGEAAQAGAASEIGAADAVVADFDREPAVAVVTVTEAFVAEACLATLVSASETTK